MKPNVSRRHALFLPWLGITPLLKGQTSYELAVPGGQIEIQFVNGGFHNVEVIFDWINRAVRAVAGFYGKFPVPRLRLFVESARGQRPVSDGIAFGGSPPFINVSVSGQATATDLADDWILTHEFAHLAFPSVPERHRWIEEGLSTFVEPLARVQAGQIRMEDYWRGFVQSLPQGQPSSNDGGLDGTRAWARTYWGGALFCFIADLRIRTQAGSGVGLQNALRAVSFRQGATINAEWPVARALQAADATIGGSHLRDVYEEWAGKPVRPDLDEIWKNLGILRDGVGIIFDEEAPLAAVRMAMVTAVPTDSLA